MMTEKDDVASETSNLSTLSLSNPSDATATHPPPVVRVENASDESADSGGGEVEENDHEKKKSVSESPPVKNVWEGYSPPSEEVKEKIIKQVEFYFSDANISKDVFLLKHISRNKQGFVSVKLISQFKKMKSLTKDWRDVAHSLISSSKIELSKESTKLRRKEPLPDPDNDVSSTRTVIGINLPYDDPSIEQLAEMFGACGKIGLIRILRPSREVPADVKPFASKHPEIGRTLCALIEYETSESAKSACNKLSDSSNWRSGMRVVPLTNLKTKKTEDGKDSTSPPAKPVDGEKKKKKKGRNKKVSDLLRDEGGYSTTSGSELEPSSRTRSGSTLSVDDRLLTSRTSPRHSPKPSPRLSTKMNQNVDKDEEIRRSSSPDINRKGSGDGSCSDSPWFQRRRLLSASGMTRQRGSPGASPLVGRRNTLTNSVTLVRKPVAPDEVAAFQTRSKLCGPAN